MLRRELGLSQMRGETLKSGLTAYAQQLGCLATGVTPPVLPPEFAAHHAAVVQADLPPGLAYLARNPKARYDARSLVAQCRAVVVVAVAYPATVPELCPPGQARVARYARGRDYHHVVREKVTKLGRWLDSRVPGHHWKAAVDTSPLGEKGFAVSAGVGWQGRHSIVLSRELGSWFMIGLLITSAELPPDTPALSECGDCRRCIDACPTQALEWPGLLHPERCLSYLTTTKNSALTAGSQLHGWLYGCDACQEACPHNMDIRIKPEVELARRMVPATLAPRDVLAANEEELRQAYLGTVLDEHDPARLKLAAQAVLSQTGAA